MPRVLVSYSRYPTRSAQYETIVHQLASLFALQVGILIELSTVLFDKRVQKIYFQCLTLCDTFTSWEGKSSLLLEVPQCKANNDTSW